MRPFQTSTKTKSSNSIQTKKSQIITTASNTHNHGHCLSQQITRMLPNPRSYQNQERDQIKRNLIRASPNPKPNRIHSKAYSSSAQNPKSKNLKTLPTKK